jgi:hypothetical protein
MRSTHDNLIGYWIVGSILIWLILPIGLLDVLVTPSWHAPNPQCDSLGIPIFQTAHALIPWAIVAASISAALVFLLVRKRLAGADIFDFRLGAVPWNCTVNLLAMAVIVTITFDVGRHVWNAAFTQMLSSDCAGRAEPVVITMRGPIFQLSPFLEIAIGLWMLHLRALFLSPRVK